MVSSVKKAVGPLDPCRLCCQLSWFPGGVKPKQNIDAVPWVAGEAGPSPTPLPQRGDSFQWGVSSGSEHWRPPGMDDTGTRKLFSFPSCVVTPRRCAAEVSEVEP